MKPAEILSELEGLLTGIWITDLANFSALMFQRVPRLNWIGFYLTDGTKLRLGPFAGQPACTDIAFERGVCGAAFTKRAPLVVDDVHEFPGHIACDPKSRSEMVLPFVCGGRLVGVLDIDSPEPARFTASDLEFFSKALGLLSARLVTFDPMRVFQ